MESKMALTLFQYLFQTSLLQKRAVFAAGLQKIHFHRYINLQPDEKCNELSLRWPHYGKPCREKWYGWGVFDSASPEPVQMMYVYDARYPQDSNLPKRASRYKMY